MVAMSDKTPTAAEQIAAIDAERNAIFAERAPADARLRALYEQRQALVEQAAAELDLDAPGGLETLVEIAWSNGMGSRTGSTRLDTYFRSFAPEIWGHEWRSTQETGETRAVPHVMLTRGQDVKALAVGLLALVRKLAAGRPVVYVSLFDHGLSQYAIYAIDVNVGDGTAVLHATSYGRRTEVVSGPLETVLARAARDHWYQREEGATDTDEDDTDRD